MADVPDHLAPKDLRLNCHIDFAGLQKVEFEQAKVELGSRARPFGTGMFLFEAEQDGRAIGKFSIYVNADPAHPGIDNMMARACRDMTDVLRQLLHEMDTLRTIHERNAARTP